MSSQAALFRSEPDGHPAQAEEVARPGGKGLQRRDYRHFSMGLPSSANTPKLALGRFQAHTPPMGITQWFDFEAPRPGGAVAWLKPSRVGLRRTGPIPADARRQGKASFHGRTAPGQPGIMVGSCFTPKSGGLAPHHTSSPKDPMHLADYSARMSARPTSAPRRKAVA